VSILAITNDCIFMFLSWCRRRKQYDGADHRVSFDRSVVEKGRDPMLSNYIRAAMERAEYTHRENGSYFAEIPGIQGVWAEGGSRDEARAELQEVLEGWIVLRLDRHHPIPEINGHTVQVAQVA
jgi:predicted RNase H-like HicB family nuclease